MPNATHTLRISSTVNGGNAQSGTVTDSAPTDTEVSLTVPASTTNQLLTIALVRANVQYYHFLADQNCTVKTNSSSSPSDTLNLKANIPYLFSASLYAAQPLSADITQIFITTTVGTNLTIRIITN